MRFSIVLSLAFSCVMQLAPLPLAAQAAVDEQAIRDLIQAHATAWNKRDAVAAAAVYSPNAVVRTSAGVLLEGREAIEAAHRQWLAEDTAGGGSIHSHPAATTRIQFVVANVAVADVDGCFAPRTRAEAPACVPLFIVVVKRSGHWLVAEQRPLSRPGS